ncbi:hypothetical protein [Thalassomonas sp. M1454]|uniref:hypothetical protein n=1 Tax=Thalassomonas sp. M1454 TaxID=2594477 RepID=UPI00117CB122|nr:hypothetical protein [Thalassomonas sp. M1454]TRX56684.1 hypothetical protein FNN08_03920 [Thalassomonas sp. M1454]
MSQHDDYEQYDEEYHDHFDEYDYHEQGVEEESSILPWLAFGLLLSSRSNNNDKDPLTTFLFFMFLPITFPFLIMKEMAVMALKIVAFLLKGIFKSFEWVFQSMVVDDLKTNVKAKQISKLNKTNSDANHLVIKGHQANNYVAKKYTQVDKSTNSKIVKNKTLKQNSKYNKSIEEVESEINRLEQYKKQLKQQAVNRIKSRDLNKADRGHYYENNDQNAKQNASKLAEQATIKYI